MSRQGKYYHRMRLFLFKALGRVCKHCGTKHDLTFDLIDPDVEPKTHHSAMSSTSRVSYYLNHYLHDNLQVLCDACNTRKGGSN